MKCEVGLASPLFIPMTVLVQRSSGRPRLMRDHTTKRSIALGDGMGSTRGTNRAAFWNVSQDLLAVIDKEGKYLSVNPAWTETLGWSEADLVGNTYGSLLHPSDRENTYDELTRLFEGHRMPRFENRLRHKDGTYRRLSWTAVPDRGLVY